ncbi:hypothetical protein, partial [Paenibacillus graminis]|uniref:hypothetical protein n=1 Tax=Paenibacillus graminis TaxID=189425 RepID=UPI001EE19ED1
FAEGAADMAAFLLWNIRKLNGSWNNTYVYKPTGYSLLDSSTVVHASKKGTVHIRSISQLKTCRIMTINKVRMGT